MYRPRFVTAVLFTTSFTLALIAVLTLPASASQRTGTSAYAYVGSPGGVGDGSIYEFAVAPDGSAQRISGSPISSASGDVVAAGNYIFSTDAKNIVTFAVESSGALHQTSYVDGIAYDTDQGSAAVLGLATSPDAHDVYSFNYYFDGSNSDIETWAIGSHGDLAHRAHGTMPVYATDGGWPLSFTSNGRFAYTWSACDWDGSVWGFARRSDGTLSRFSPGAQNPPPMTTQGFPACSQAVATSAHGYVAVAWNGGFCCGGSPTITTYRIQSNGNLALVANSERFISCGVTSPMAFDPTGTYLAVACNGIQVYKLSSAGLLSKVGSLHERGVPLANLQWDAANHLYAATDPNSQLCQSHNHNCGLYIFNSNAGALSLASGSPHTIPLPGSLAVLGH